MTAIVKIYKRDFTQLAELTSVALEERSWLLNGIGSCVFHVGLSDAQNVAENFHIGNIVRIKSDLGVSDWVGRMDEISWDDPESVTVKCNGREALLQGPVVRLNIHSTDGIANMFHWFNNDPYTSIIGVKPGRIMSAQLTEDQTIDLGVKFYDAIAQAAETLHADFYVDHNTGLFYFDRHLGENRSNEVWLESGDFVASPSFKVNATNLIWYCRVNGMIVHGTPHWVEVIDEQIREFVGGDVRQQVIQAPGLMMGDALKKIAEYTIEQSLKGLFTLDVSINDRRGLQRKFFLGDTIGMRVNTFAWGMVGAMRCIGLAVVNEDSPEFRLILEPTKPRELFRTFNPEVRNK